MTYRNKSVIKNTTTNWAMYEYVPNGKKKFASSALLILRYWMKNSTTNGSDGRISLRKPKMHSTNDIFIQLLIIFSVNGFFAPNVLKESEYPQNFFFYKIRVFIEYSVFGQLTSQPCCLYSQNQFGFVYTTAFFLYLKWNNKRMN